MIVPVKTRLDKLMVERGLAQSRERAQALILAGRVLVNEQKLEKPGASVAEDVVVRMLGSDLRYVSRGGLKLERALEHWGINLNDLHCADIGASTGGFTDCMLQNGAASVIAVDTGYGQIAQKLRSDARVRLMEKTNARLLPASSLYSSSATISFFCMDVSFISASIVLPAILRALDPSTWRGEGIVLVKPQFEAGREHVGKGGIVRDEAAQMGAVERVRHAVTELGGSEIEVIDSPIRGMEGNREFLLRVRFQS